MEELKKVSEQDSLYCAMLTLACFIEDYNTGNPRAVSRDVPCAICRIKKKIGCQGQSMLYFNVGALARSVGINLAAPDEHISQKVHAISVDRE